MYIVVLATRTEQRCERYDTYEAALRRVEQTDEHDLVGMPFIFKELADGSQRLIRGDGKPLQWHRLPQDGDAPPEKALPVTEELPADTTTHFERPMPVFDDEPLPLVDEVPPGLEIREIFLREEDAERCKNPPA